MNFAKVMSITIDGTNTIVANTITFIIVSSPVASSTCCWGRRMHRAAGCTLVGFCVKGYSRFAWAVASSQGPHTRWNY